MSELKRVFLQVGTDQVECNIPCEEKFINSISGNLKTGIEIVSGISHPENHSLICVHPEAPQKTSGIPSLGKNVTCCRTCKIYTDLLKPAEKS